MIDEDGSLAQIDAAIFNGLFDGANRSLAVPNLVLLTGWAESAGTIRVCYHVS